MWREVWVIYDESCRFYAHARLLLPKVAMKVWTKREWKNFSSCHFNIPTATTTLPEESYELGLKI